MTATPADSLRPPEAAHPDEAPSKPVSLEEAAHTMHRRLARLVEAQDRGTLARIRHLVGSRRDPVVLHAMLLALVPPAPAEVDPEAWRQACVATAIAYCVFHAGKSEAEPGSGSLGSAMRRLSRHLDDEAPVAPTIERAFQMIVSARTRSALGDRLVDLVRRLYDSGMTPPYWPQLVEDLTRWKPGDQDVLLRWATDLYAPQHRTRS